MPEKFKKIIPTNQASSELKQATLEEVQRAMEAMQGKAQMLFSRSVEERLHEFGAKLHIAADLGQISTDEEKQLLDLLKYDDPKNFLTAGRSVLEKLARMSLEKPALMEEIGRRVVLMSHPDWKSLPDNRLLVYEEPDEHGFVRLHVLQNRTASLLKQFSMIQKGLRDLAEIAKADEKINAVGGSSPLVEKNPGLFVNLGFDVAEAPPEIAEKYFLGERIKVAIITREKLLEKYGKEQKKKF